MTPHETISLKIAELTSALTSAHPSMPALLQTILRELQQDPEVVTLINPEQRAQIVAGLMKQTSTEITVSMTAGNKGKTLKKVGVDDI